MIIYDLEEIRSLFEAIEFAGNSFVRVDRTDFDSCMSCGGKQCVADVTSNGNRETFIQEAKQEIGKCLQHKLNSCIIILITHDLESVSEYMNIALLNEVTADLEDCDTIMGITTDTTLPSGECRIVLFGAYD